MKPSIRSGVLLCLAASLLLCPSVHADAVLPMSLPAGFEPAETDFADAQPRGQFLGVTGLRGRPLKPQSGVHAVYLVSAPPAGTFADDPFQVGDVIVALEEQPFVSDPMLRLRRKFSDAQQFNARVTFDRWRDGQTQTVTVHFVGPQPPDLTAGGVHDPEHEDWALGATGAQGWIWAIAHQTTEGAKQIYITQIEPDSPAARVLEVGDVIVGALGQMFELDARKEFGNALTTAESGQFNGRLPLTVWRNGQTREVELQIEALGDYSQTAPFDCPKTQRIIDGACDYLKANGLGTGISSLVNALGLLSTGREDVMPLVREKVMEVAASAPPDSSWFLGYSNLLLTEYFLLTGDDSVIPAIEAYSNHIARGTSRVGTLGHRICIPYQFTSGTAYGIAPGYGALSAAALPCFTSLVLAQKCGVNNDDIASALDRASGFYRFYVDRGSVPYGDHPPQIEGLEDNGKVSMAAVFFDLRGEHEAADFFTRMTLASYDEREPGHTGNYFSFLWGTLGAARGGDAAASAFMQRLTWFFDLERRRQGNFEYQGKPGMRATRNAEHAYKGWDCTGARLLAYTVGQKKLYLTGKGRTIPPITGDALQAVFEAGELTPRQYFNLPTHVLLAKLSNWAPAVRHRAAVALGAKSDDVVDELLMKLNSDDRYTRYGALQALRFAGRASEQAADAIVAKALASDDNTFKFFALRAFGSYDMEMGLAAHAPRAAPQLMTLASAGQWVDPTGQLKGDLAYNLFYSGNAHPYRALARNGEGLDAMNRELLVDTVRELLQVPNGGSRSNVTVIYDKLSDDELKLLWKDIYVATRQLAPSGLMFASGVRLSGIDLMARHRTREGMETAAWFLTNQQGHGNEPRAEHVLKVLVETYAGHAKQVIPVLQESVAYYETGPGMTGSRPSPIADMIRNAITAIESAQTPDWELTSIAEYVGDLDVPAAP
jgi:hypothetical protein